MSSSVIRRLRTRFVEEYTAGPEERARREAELKKYYLEHEWRVTKIAIDNRLSTGTSILWTDDKRTLEQTTTFVFRSEPRWDTHNGIKINESQAVQWAREAWSAEMALENTTVTLRMSDAGAAWYWTATMRVSYAPQAAPQPTREANVKHELEGIYLPVKAPVDNIKKEPVPVD